MPRQNLFIVKMLSGIAILVVWNAHMVKQPNLLVVNEHLQAWDHWQSKPFRIECHNWHQPSHSNNITLNTTSLAALTEIRINKYNRAEPIEIDESDLNTILDNLPPITASCVVLVNPVVYHSEVQIAIHSYLLSNGLPVCNYDYLDAKLGYNEWFQPPASFSLSLAPHLPVIETFHAFMERSQSTKQKHDNNNNNNNNNNKNKNITINRPTILVTLTPTQIFPLSDRKPPHHGPLIHTFPRAIVLVHEPAIELEENRLRFEDAKSSNWTLGFLSPRVEETWHSGIFVNSSNFNQHVTSATTHSRTTTQQDFLRQSSNPQTFSFVPIWQAPTTIPQAPRSPYIRSFSHLELKAKPLGFVNWTLALQPDQQSGWLTSSQNLTHTTVEEIKTWKYIVVQGSPIKQRRDYQTLFDWAAISDTITNTPNAKILIMGRVFENFRTQLPVIKLQENPLLQDRILYFPSTTHIQFSNILEHSRAVYTALYVNDWSYVDFKCSGTVPTTLSQAIPILGDSRIGLAYGQSVLKGIVEFRNLDIRAKTKQDSPMPPPPSLPYSFVKTVNPKRPTPTQHISDTPGVLASFDTFEDAVAWLFGLDDSKFVHVRETVLAVREALYEKNVRLFAEMIHAAQIAQNNNNQ